MPHVSRPLVALLLATVVFFAVWMVALKPKSGGSLNHTAPLGSAIGKAHAAVAQSNAASAAHGGTIATAPTATSTLATHTPTTAAAKRATTAATAHKTATGAATTHKAATASKPADASVLGAAARRHAVVTHALQAHKVIALLFYNYRAADDRAVKKELAVVSTHGGRVVKEAVPLVELARYRIVTQQVPVTASPTLILIDRQHKAWTIVGYATEFEISQRVTDALAVKPKA